MATTKKKPAKKPAKEKLNYEQQSAAGGWLQLDLHRIRVTPEEALKVLTVRDELRDEGAALSDGTKVQTVMHAVRWIIGQIELRSEDVDQQ
ncbi:hypothetical protein [Rhodopirellula halodulae]|uniref:hypothetical protein n=1 Tax=Rhodopirellula halodulae TaxID=2894198 RepID=UPI001E3803AD|nr:hypothetical protein [Rhodopirellula sp. JC737]MCC9655293.1 hypothetical protein [Rhodopirellula sp. JC737]